MEFAIMPDGLYGASVRINGKWLGIVEERPLGFTMPDHGTYIVLLELTPLATDPSGDVHPLPIARVFHVGDGRILEPATIPDGFLHLRRTARSQRHDIHYAYPKTEALGYHLESLPQLSQTETADFDRDGRLDTVEVYTTDRAAHVRVRSATGTLLLSEVFPDPKLHIEVADITRDGRADLLIFWHDEEPRVMLWESADGSLSSYEGFTGIRRLGRGDALLEIAKGSPFRQATELFRYSRKVGESAQFERVRTEEQLLRRAEDPTDTVEAFLTALEQNDRPGAQLFLARGVALPELGNLYAHEIDTADGSIVTASAFEWLMRGFYDVERSLRFDFVQQPDKISEWKIGKVQETDSR
ncbi:MAG: VCBS repeat-containing protein [Tumebacillaceae bacterium]